MSATLHTFADIFEVGSDNSNESVAIRKIVIPIIQRDYAQGRKDPGIERIRERFLESLYSAVVEKPITLDFIYGDVDEKGVMTPLDGQQRLTTLFLLYWYAARKENVPETECLFLKGFSYETRPSARDFCLELIEFHPSFSGSLSNEIINQPWFPLDWKKDATVSSMLVMLDSINSKFSKVEGLWEKLKSGAISFYFLPVKEMGLTDDLYIKMNSRGKPLTLFEHFKAELEGEIRKQSSIASSRIAGKIDGEWTDLLWKYRAEDSTTDNEFLRYFRFVCAVICYKNGESPRFYSSDIFSLVGELFSSMKNIELLESFFDCWCGGFSIDEFLASFMTHDHENGKILVDERAKIDILEDCLHSEDFPMNRFLLLYSIVVYLQNRDTVGSAFGRRIRIVNNLIQNSGDEIAERVSGNRIPAVLSQIDSIILTGEIDDSIAPNFNGHQLKEEKEKICFLATSNSQSDIDSLFKLEDHDLLHGQIGIVGLDNLDKVEAFYTLFDCDWDKVDCALMSIGNYSQYEGRNHLYQFGSSSRKDSWIKLFHRSSYEGFDNTHRILIDLLKTCSSFTNDILQKKIDGFLSEMEEKHSFSFQYYYVKYNEFRPGAYGQYRNEDASKSPYLYTVLQTSSNLSSNSYMPYLWCADEAHVDRTWYGQRLTFPSGLYIICENDSYKILRTEDDSEVDMLSIKQEGGIDCEDRILLLKEYLKG